MPQTPKSPWIPPFPVLSTSGLLADPFSFDLYGRNKQAFSVKAQMADTVHVWATRSLL